MTVRELNVLTGDIAERPYTEEEIAAQAASQQPIPSAPKPFLIGQTRLAIDGLAVSGFGAEAGIASAGIIDDGVLYVEFSALIDLPYLVWLSDGAGHRVYSLPSEQDEFGFMIRSEAETGDPELPPQIQILIAKA